MGARSRPGAWPRAWHVACFVIEPLSWTGLGARGAGLRAGLSGPAPANGVSRRFGGSDAPAVQPRSWQQ